MRYKKVLALLLAAAVLFSMTSMAAYAAEEETDTPNLFGYTEDGVYINEYFDISVALPRGWSFYTEEQLLLLQGMVSDALGEVGYEYADRFEEILTTTDACFVAAATSDDGMANFSIIVQYMSGVDSPLTEDDMVEIGMGETGFGSESLAGMYESVEPNSCVLGGVEHRGIKLYSVDNSLGVELPVYQQLVFVMGGEYALQITMSGFINASVIDTMTEFFSTPSADAAA